MSFVENKELNWIRSSIVILPNMYAFIDTVLSEFINFVGNLPIATSNKQFDISFINVALKKLGKPLLDNKIIDL